MAGPAWSADLVAAPAPAAAAPPSFFLFTDTVISYRYQPNGREPGVTSPLQPQGRDIPKNIIAITHADAWAYGSNFVNIDFLKSGAQDPAAGGGEGALEVYALYRGNLSGNALTGTKAFSFGIVKDINFEFGADLNTKNTAFAPEKRLVVLGPNIAFDVSGGFINLGIHYSQEVNHNGITRRQVNFDPAAEAELTYSIPLTFTGLPLSWAGFANVVAPKGRDGFGRSTQTEFLQRTNLVLDLGKLVADRPNLVDVFVAYQYWHNKFGNDHRFVAGAVESSVMGGIAFHLPK